MKSVSLSDIDAERLRLLRRKMTPKRRAVLERLHKRGSLGLVEALEGIAELNILPPMVRLGWVKLDFQPVALGYAITDAGRHVAGLD